jgi:hypothetical protein
MGRLRKHAEICLSIFLRLHSNNVKWSRKFIGLFTTWRNYAVNAFKLHALSCLKIHQWRDCLRNVMAHAQKPNFVYRRSGRVHLIRRGGQFIRLLAAEVYASEVVMLDTSCSEVAWRVTGIPLHPPVSPSFSLLCVTVFRHISTGLFFCETVWHLTHSGGP